MKKKRKPNIIPWREGSCSEIGKLSEKQTRKEAKKLEKKSEWLSSHDRQIQFLCHVVLAFCVWKGCDEEEYESSRRSRKNLQ